MTLPKRSEPRYLTQGEFEQYARGIQAQLSDMKDTLNKIDGKLDDVRSKTIPSLQRQSDTLTVKAKMFFGGVSFVLGLLGAFIVRLFSGMF